MSNQPESLADFYPSYEALLKTETTSDEFVNSWKAELEADGSWDWFLAQIAKESDRDPINAYPGQGLVVTGYEEADAEVELQRVELGQEFFEKTIHGWLYYVLLFNHPERLKALFETSEKPFVPPAAKFHPFFLISRWLRRSVTINDLKLNAHGSHKPRVQRTEAHKKSLFVGYQRQMSMRDRLKNYLKLSRYNQGRAQARNVIIGAANPEITGTPMALATLAMAHSLVNVPRDGYFANVTRQADLVKEAMEWLHRSPVLKHASEEEKAKLLDFWQHNLVGVVEANVAKAPDRVEALYDAGVRTFRIYSPEPSSAPLETLKKIRQMEAEKGWEPIEIFVGQVVDVQQALELEAAGANALYFGIGGGGRCITGVVAGLTINWPELVWQLRGKLNIPMLIEGGANDHLPESLAVGASGIGAAGKFGGTIETPGGYLFLIKANGDIFKYYGGEASDRMRFMAGRKGPNNYMLNREGETRDKGVRNGGHDLATMLQVLYEFEQGIVGGMVFQNAHSIPEMQEQGAKSLRQASPNDDAVRNTH